MSLRRAASFVLVLFGLSPLLVLVLRQLPGAPPVAALVDGWFELQCRRDAVRAARVFDVTLPVCSRCLGIYLGFALGTLLGAVAVSKHRGSQAQRFQLTGRKLLGWTLAGAGVMLLDVGSEALGLRPALGWLRFATGLALALPVAVALGVALGPAPHCAPGRELQHSE